MSQYKYRFILFYFLALLEKYFVTFERSGVQVSRTGRQEHGPDQGPDPDRGAAGESAQQGAAQTGGHDEPPEAGAEWRDGG